MGETEVAIRRSWRAAEAHATFVLFTHQHNALSQGADRLITGRQSEGLGKVKTSSFSYKETKDLYNQQFPEWQK